MVLRRLGVGVSDRKSALILIGDRVQPTHPCASIMNNIQKFKDYPWVLLLTVP